MAEPNKPSGTSPSHFLQWISMPTTLFLFITWLVWLEYGHAGLKVLIWGMAGLFVAMIVFFIYDYGIKSAERQIDLGSRMVTRADYVDAAGDAMKLQAQAGKQVKLVEPKQLEAQVEELFSIVPFSLPTETASK